MDKNYARAIDIIASDSAINYREMALIIAKLSPAAFVVMHEELSGASDTSSNDQGFEDLDTIVEHVRAGRIVEAIKLFRAISGAGLKESKDVVDAMKLSPIKRHVLIAELKRFNPGHSVFRKRSVDYERIASALSDDVIASCSPDSSPDKPMTIMTIPNDSSCGF